MRAGWWWIDRWRKSTAYTDMTLAEQGAYRNLLDELWLRDGQLPTEERILAKISGDATAWAEVREAVLARFHEVDGTLRHETHDAIQAESKRRAEKQQRYRDRLKERNGDRNGGGNVTGDITPSPSPSPDQSLEPDQIPPLPPRGRAPAAPAWEQALRERQLEGRGFEPACERWTSYRREARLKAWPKTTWKAALSKLDQDPELFARSVENSIANGYSGLFPPRTGTKPSQAPEIPGMDFLRQMHEQELAERAKAKGGAA